MKSELKVTAFSKCTGEETVFTFELEDVNRSTLIWEICQDSEKNYIWSVDSLGEVNETIEFFLTQRDFGSFQFA